MSDTIWVKCVNCGSDAERGAFRDYCTSMICKFQDSEARTKYLKTQRRQVDDDTTQPVYIPPSRLFKYSEGDTVMYKGNVYTVDRVLYSDDCYELISKTGITYLRWPRDLVESLMHVEIVQIPCKAADEELVEFEIECLPDSVYPATCLELAVEDWTKYPLSRDACVIDNIIKKAEK